ncbi:hypothetical protein [Sporocytophaga myxococcoides]|nr:hypothetical protein [Sporocytophaga myxococcoides]
MRKIILKLLFPVFYIYDFVVLFFTRKGMSTIELLIRVENLGKRD